MFGKVNKRKERNTGGEIEKNKGMRGLIMSGKVK